MTPNQTELVRHALGLSRRIKVSYRNHFVISADATDYKEWLALVTDGDAVFRDGKKLPFGGSHLFHATLAGALKVLKPGESLSHEDFPESLKASHGPAPSP